MLIQTEKIIGRTREGTHWVSITSFRYTIT